MNPPVQIAIGDRMEIYRLFPIPCTSEDMTGISNTTVIKFQTFYLRFEEDMRQRPTLRVIGFLYGSAHSVFEKTITWDEIHEFCARFTRDDYLSNYTDKWGSH